MRLRWREHWFENLPLKVKLSLAMLVTCGTALLLACAALAFYERIDFRRAMTRDATILANILGQNAQAAVTFKDDDAATVLLRALQAEPNVVAARIFDSSDAILADYRRSGSLPVLSDVPEVDGHRFRADALELFHPITLERKRIGTIYLQMDLKRVYERFYLFACTAGAVLAASLLLVLAMSNQLLRRIFQPILTLAEVARSVAERRDYSVRAPVREHNEIGDLTLAFNHMLTQIQQQNSLLTESEENERFLAEASALLSGSLDVERTLADLAELAVPSLADWCAIDLWENGVLRRVTVHHSDPARTELVTDLHHRYPPRPDDPVFAVANGEPSQLVELVDSAQLQALAVDEDHRRLIETLGMRSFALIPLRSRDRTLGVLGLMTDGDRRLKRSDLVFYEEIGKRAAIAIENAQLYQDEREARNYAAEKAEALSRSNAELEQFAYVASHDLQEPLRMVRQYLNLLELRLAEKLDGTTKQFMSYAIDGAQRMNALINDLLAYARIGHGEKQLQDVDLERVVLEVKETLSLKIEETGARITSDPLPSIRGDKLQLVQVVQNLLANAMKFRGADPPRIHISCESDNDSWTISVRDNGIGIEPAYQKRIFDVFQRLHGRQEYPGTGIGLAICKRIVERYGGRIWVESESGKGSTFRFTLAKASYAEVTPASSRIPQMSK